MKTMKINIEQILSNYLNCIKEMAIQDGECQEHVEENITTIASGNMQGIRQLFIDGYTVLLVGELMNDIDCGGFDTEEIEIRVYNNESLLGVIINSEILY